VASARKVPIAEALTLYVGLGHVRSYAAVAKHFGVGTRTILFIAKKYRWPEKLRAIEAIAEERQREHNVGLVIEARERHLKALRVLQGKALAGLRDNSARSVAESTKALEASIRLERLILGESTSNSSISVEERQQRECDQLVVDEDGDADPDEAELGRFELGEESARDEHT
jgi:hypothetical protein